MILFLNTWQSEKNEVFKALIKIEGIGKNGIKQILDYAGVSARVKIGDLSSAQISKMKRLIDQNFYIEQELQNLNNKNRERLYSIGCYRSLRHMLGLPSRGQNTQSNAKTCRKLKSTIGKMKSTKPKYKASSLSRKTIRKPKQQLKKK